MPRSAEPSKATQNLIKELAGRGIIVSARAAEGWAERGLAPAPIRRSLGRGRGTVSEYPPGAVDQYAAVAAVVRRGKPWQLSVLQLLARGYLPSDESLVYQALQELLSYGEMPADADALAHAEHRAADAARAPFGPPVLGVYERNLRRSAAILEPGTVIGAVAVGVVTTLTLALAGRPDWSPGALVELMAAHGVPVAQLAEDDLAGLARAADALLAELFGSRSIAQLAAETPLSRLQSAIPNGHAAVQRAFASAGQTLPRPTEDIAEALAVLGAVLQIRIEDLGGDEALASLMEQAFARRD